MAEAAAAQGPLQEQAIAWDGDREELDMLCSEIRVTYFDEDDYDDVYEACMELVAKEQLPVLHRVQLELFLATLAEDDEGEEHLKDARYWLNDLEITMESTGLKDERVVGLQQQVTSLRVQFAFSKPPAPEPLPMPPPATSFKSAAEITREELGPEVTFEEKLEGIKEGARFEREMLKVKAEKEAAAARGAEAGQSSLAGTGPEAEAGKMTLPGMSEDKKQTEEAEDEAAISDAPKDDVALSEESKLEIISSKVPTPSVGEDDVDKLKDAEGALGLGKESVKGTVGEGHGHDGSSTSMPPTTTPTTGPEETQDEPVGSGGDQSSSAGPAPEASSSSVSKGRDRTLGRNKSMRMKNSNLEFNASGAGLKKKRTTRGDLRKMFSKDDEDEGGSGAGSTAA